MEKHSEMILSNKCRDWSTRHSHGYTAELLKQAADEIDRLRNIISGIGLEYPLPKINTAPFRDAAKDYALPDGQIREHLSEAADLIEDRDYMIELEQKAHATTKEELARYKQLVTAIQDRVMWGNSDAACLEVIKLIGEHAKGGTNK